MPLKPLDLRLTRVEARRAAADAESDTGGARQRQLWRAEAAIGAMIRGALAQRGVDPAGVTRLALADDAAAALAEIPDTPELRCADAAAAPPVGARDRAIAEGLAAKITAMTRAASAAPPPDFANASFAELFAWSLAAPSQTGA